MYASLHTDNPENQSQHEVSYEGYSRLSVEITLDFGKTPVELIFAEIPETLEGSITHVAFGESAIGDGAIEGKPIHMMPYIPMEKGNKPRVIVINEVPLPEELHPMATVMYELVQSGELKAEDIHPRLYEETNNELQKHGVPVIPVTRSATADMIGKMSNLSSLSELS